MKKFFLFTLFFLTGCGFSPLYKEITPENNTLSINVLPIPDQYGFSMRKIIQNKLGNSTGNRYTLTVSSPAFSSWDQTIDEKNFATMMGLTGTVSYQLLDTINKKQILNNSASLTSSYAVIKDPYATTVAERKVKKELANQLAEQVSLHVLGTLVGENN